MLSSHTVAMTRLHCCVIGMLKLLLFLVLPTFSEKGKQTGAEAGPAIQLPHKRQATCWLRVDCLFQDRVLHVARYERRWTLIFDGGLASPSFDGPDLRSNICQPEQMTFFRACAINEDCVKRVCEGMAGRMHE